MKNRTEHGKRIVQRVLPTACAAMIALGFAAAPAPPARAERLTPRPVPAGLRVAPGNQAYLEGHALGTQNYICLPSEAGFAWTLFAPQATLFGERDAQLITHYASPNPSEGNVLRVTWQHSRDSSTVWAKLATSSSDPAFVASGAIPWLLLEVVGSRDGAGRSGALTSTTFIQRVNTTGGTAPSSGCAQSADVGKKALVPYTADYVFYTGADGEAYGGD